VLFWGGLRGAISLALALSLPAAFPDRELLRVMTLGVVVFLLLAQGATMGLLIRRLRLESPRKGRVSTSAGRGVCWRPRRPDSGCGS
jgi:NhaP-type Na+/H+ or K+/H+ antiporter